MPHPRAVVPLDWIRTKDQQALAVELGEWVAGARDRRRRAAPRGTRPAAAAGRRGSVRRREPAGRAARRDSTPAGGSASRLRPTTLADPGPARVRQDVHRRADDRGPAAAGKRSGSPPTATRSSATSCEAVSEAADGPGRRPARSSTGRGGPGASTIRRGHAREGRRRTSGARSTTAARTGGRDGLAVGRRPKMAEVRRRAVRRRGGPDLARQRRRDRPARPTASCCSATRSSSTSRARARTRRAPSGRRWRTSSATQATMPPERGLFLETDVAPAPGRLCAFTSEVFYDGRLSRSRTSSHQALARRALARRAPGRALVAVAHDGQRQRVARGGRARSRRSRGSLVEGGATLDRRARARSAPIGWDDVLIVAPYNAQVGAISGRLPPRRRASARSTSSRARRRRSASTRWRPPRRSSRRAAWTSSTAGNRLNVATSRARCVAVVVALAGPAARPRRDPGRRCGSRTRSAASSRWPGRHGNRRPPWCRPGSRC